MSKTAGLWIAIGGEPLAGPVERSIHERDQFTSTVVTSDVKPRPAELAVISLGGSSADFVGICQAGRKVATGQATILVTNLIRFSELPSRELREALPKAFRDAFAPVTSGFQRPTPRLWEEILSAIAQKRPEVRARLKDLQHIVAASKIRLGRIEGGLEVFERDAVACALQAWGGTSMRKRILRTAVSSRSVPLAPFLSQLKGAKLREDPQINHDHVTFPGMEVAQRAMVGSVVMSDNYGSEYLTILNCNRQPLEQTLGVDLIYYNHKYDSFVLVQYKRMTADEGRNPVYRPATDTSHMKELSRMIATEKYLKSVAKSAEKDMAAYRLSGRPFYLKFCEAKVKAALEAGMVSGMYVPLGLWRRLLKSSSVVGKKGGIGVSWDNCTRKFNNGEFTNLLRHGWIGSSPGHSKHLAKIIEDVLGSGRMLVLAATSAGPSAPDFRRDSLGQFASEDDPDGAV